MLRAPLHNDFRYVYEPLPLDDVAIPVLGHGNLDDDLREQLRYSHGGAFLVTGFRGVGKSTLIHRALAKAAREWDAPERLLVVRLNVARLMTTDQLLFAVVRRIFEALNDEGLLARLPRTTQDALLLAYTRTSLSFKHTRSESTDRGVSLGPAPGMPHFAPTPSFNRASSNSRATEAAFLAYSETDVEHDLIRIIQLLGNSVASPHTTSGRTLLRRRRGRSRELRVHPVVVIDEVDKMTDGRSEALVELEKLLGQLKNVLASRGAHFLIIGGPDLHDQSVRDNLRGSGIYESVFGWTVYVPCIWDAATRLLDGTLGVSPVRAENEAEHAAELVNVLQGYLAFKARGIPRRLLREFNAFVVWDDGRPWIHVSADDWPRVEFYSELEAVTARAVAAIYARGLAALPIDEDRARLSGYFIVDWTLRSQGRPFTAVDVAEAADVDPMLRMTAPAVNRFLHCLKEADVLDLVRDPNQPENTRFGRDTKAEYASFALSAAYRKKLAFFVSSSASERKDLGLTDFPMLTPVTALPDDDTLVETAPLRSTPSLGILAGRFELRELLGEGGMGTVYRARDLVSGDQVAVKMLRRGAELQPEFRARLQREGRIGSRIIHPRIARTLDLVEETDGSPALILELIEGPTLREVIDKYGSLPTGMVVRLARETAEALAAAESAGIVRLDLKPTNIMLAPGRGAVLVDLGIARTLQPEGTALTSTGMLIGTPHYMAPEAAEGLPSDIKSDVFSLGTMLFECLHGALPWSGPPMAVLYRVIHAEVPVDELRVSDGLKALLKSALAKTSADRPSPTEFIARLNTTPEAGAELSLEDFLDMAGSPTHLMPESAATVSLE